MSTAETAERFAREYERCSAVIRTGAPQDILAARQRRTAILRAVREAKVTREFNCYLTGDAFNGPEEA